jgi:hypothetical protein
VIASNPAIASKSSVSSSDPITYRQFATLARQRGWTAAALAERFRGKIDHAGEFFNRVIAGNYPDVVIVFRSVVAFYVDHARPQQHTTEKSRVCACGCGAEVFDRKKWASPGCKKRFARRHVTDKQNRVREVVDFVDSKPGQNQAMATYLNPPSTRDKRPLKQK